MLTNRAKLCFLLFFLLIVTISCEKITRQRAQHYFEKGKKLYDTGEYIKATGEFKNALIFYPDFFDALYLQGMAYYRLGAFKSAYLCFNEALKQKPDDTSLRLLTINVALQWKDYGQALHQVELLLGIDKDNTEAVYLKLYTLIASRGNENVHKAREEITALIKNGYGDERIYCLLAQANIFNGNLMKAEEILEQHYTSHGVWIEAMQWLATAHIKESNFEQAVKTYNKMLSKLEGSEKKYSIQNEFVAFLMQNNILEPAENVLQDMVREHPDSPVDRIKFIACLIGLGKLDEAEKTINAGIKKNPDNFDLKKMLITVSLKKNDIDETIAIAKNILSSLQENGVQYVELKNIIADIYFSNGKAAESKAFSQEVLAVDPKNAQAKFNLCRIALRNKADIAVIGELRQLNNENPGNPEYSYYLGLAHKERGEALLAQKAFEDTLTKAPGHKNALLALFDIYMARGIYREMERYVEAYLKINPNDDEVKYLLQNAKQKPSSIDNDTEK